MPVVCGQGSRSTSPIRLLAVGLRDVRRSTPLFHRGHNRRRVAFTTPPVLRYRDRVMCGDRRTCFTILHLSDIHRTVDQPVSNDEILNYLEPDLERHQEYDIPRLDMVVVSGDLTQSAEPNEYEETAALLGQLLADRKLPPSRLVVVPGNHDVHWPTARKAGRHGFRVVYEQTGVAPGWGFDVGPVDLRRDYSLYEYLAASPNAWSRLPRNLRGFARDVSSGQ